MPGSYFYFLGLKYKKDLEEAAAQIRKKRSKQTGKLTGTTLKNQLEKAYQTPMRDVLEELDESLIRLEETHQASFPEISKELYTIQRTTGGKADLGSNSENSKRVTDLKDGLREVIALLRESLSYRNRNFYLKGMPKLQKELTDLSIYTSYLYVQMEMYQNTENYSLGILIKFIFNGVGNLVKKYNRNIGRNLSLAKEKYSENLLVAAIQPADTPHRGQLAN
ncbi:MAG TPA: hypothetical protein VM123_11105 [archaeon]|nr:hypothetical protein [archaeon]